MRSMSVKSTRKGISPLIAAVLLIAFTMSVAVILASWAQSYGQSRLEEAGAKGESAIECSGIYIDVGSMAWKEGDDEIQAIVWNTGEGNITNFEFEVYNKSSPSTPNIVVPENSNERIAPGKFVTLEATGISEEPSTVSVRVLPKKCPKFNPIRTCQYEGGDFEC